MSNWTTQNAIIIISASTWTRQDDDKRVKLDITERVNQHVQLDKGRAKASSSAILIFTSCFCVAVVEVTVEK